MSALAAWDSFYIIVGPAAGALIGLQFVIMTLMADRPARISADAGRSFATPTVVHFCVVLLVAALARVPWPLAILATGSAGAAGVAGLVYMIAIVVRMRRQSDYTMDGEDRCFHVVLPFIGYGALVVSSVVALAHFELALFGIGLASLILLFDGIHNAWDAIAWQVLVLRAKDNAPAEKS